MKKKIFSAVLAALVSITSIYFSLSYFNKKARLPKSEVMAQTASDWAMAGHDPKRSGYSPDTVTWIADSPKWRFDLYSTVASERSNTQASHMIAAAYQPIVVSGRVFVGTLDNYMLALNGETGNLLWEFSGNKGGSIDQSPTVAGNLVYFGSTDGYVYARNTTDGILAWRFNSRLGLGGFSNNPLVISDSSTNNQPYLLIGSRDGYFYCLNAITGAKIWDYQIGAPILNSPAYADGIIYFGAENMKVYALSVSNGAKIWESVRLYGQSFRDFYPVIGSDVVMLTANPGGNFVRFNLFGDTCLGEGQGIANVSLPTTPGGVFKWAYQYTPCDAADKFCFNITANPTCQPADSGCDCSIAGQNTFKCTPLNTEQDQILSCMQRYPEYQTFFVLNKSNGVQKFVAPVLYAGGCNGTLTPPVVGGDGKVYVRYRTYFSDYDPVSYYQFGAVGILDTNIGKITHLSLTQESPEYTNFIDLSGDESASLSIANNNLFITHSDMFGAINLLTNIPSKGHGYRDQPWRLSPRNIPFLGAMSNKLYCDASPSVWHGPAIGGVSFANGRIYWQTSSIIGAIKKTGE